MKTPLIAATLLISASTVSLYAQQESSGVSHPPDDAIVESTPQPAPAKAKPSAALPYSSESATTPAASSQPTFKVIGPVSRPPAADNPDADIVTEVPPSDDQVESHLPAQNPSSSDARPAPTQIASSQGLSPALKPRVEPNPDQGIVTEVPINPNELPSGTELRVRLAEEISTTTTTVGTPFHGEIIEPVMHNGQTIIPAGAELRGHVTEVRGGRRIKGSALIHLEPQSIVLPDGSQYHLNASVIDSDQFADTRASKVPRHGISARPCGFVDDHDLRSKNRALWLVFVFAIARGDQAQQLALKNFNDVSSERASTVEALVHDHRFFANLREEVAGEVGVAAKPGYLQTLTKGINAYQQNQSHQ